VNREREASASALNRARSAFISNDALAHVSRSRFIGSQHPAKTMNSQTLRGIQRAAKVRTIMEKLDKDLQNWLWFFTGAAVVISAGLAKIKLSERL